MGGLKVPLRSIPHLGPSDIPDDVPEQWLPLGSLRPTKVCYGGYFGIRV